MILRRDHIVGGVLLVLAGLVFAISGDLPVGTLGSPGPGMVPTIAIALIAVFAVVLLVTARASPPAAGIDWTDLPHAVVVTLMAAGAILLYERLGFLITMASLIFVLLAVAERIEAWKAALFAIGVTLTLKILLIQYLKSPLPVGPFGF